MVEDIKPNLDFGKGYWRGKEHGYKEGLMFAINLIEEARAEERDRDEELRSFISTLRWEGNYGDG